MQCLLLINASTWRLGKYKHALKHGWWEIEGSNLWHSTQLNCYKISSVSKSNSGQVDDCSHCWGTDAQCGGMADCRAAAWPFADQSAHMPWFHTKLEGFKGPSCDALILSPSSNIWNITRERGILSTLLKLKHSAFSLARKCNQLNWRVKNVTGNNQIKKFNCQWYACGAK